MTRWISLQPSLQAPLRRSALLCILLALCALGLSGPGGGAWAQTPAGNDEIIPAGRFMVRAAFSSQTHERAINTVDQEVPLLEFLVPDAAVNAQIDGAVTRTIERLDLELRLGLEDIWNVSLTLPVIRIRQDSSLSTGSASSTVQREVTRLGNREITGLGPLTVFTSYRGFFEDAQSYSWGYGMTLPLGSPESPYAGRGTLYLGSPFHEVFLINQYERYLLTSQGRFQAYLELRAPFARTLTNTEGRTVKVHPGNYVRYSLHWEQEFGPFQAGLGLRSWERRKSSEDGEKQKDGQEETVSQVKLGWGNLHKLERGPVRHPWQVTLQLEKTYKGYNVPLRDEVALLMKLYF